MSSAQVSSAAKSSGKRLQYLDWLRGLAAVIMLQGHVFHSFNRTDLHTDGPYIWSQFIGGMPPAIFLFLTGITLAFRMDGAERKGISGWARVTGALGRARYLILLAFAFRAQLWLFGYPHSRVMDLFKVDILNAMALAIAAMSLLALVSTVDRAKLGALFGVAIASASPLMTALPWDRTHWLVKAYLAPDYQLFAFFPWAAFLAFGLSMGSLLRLSGESHLERLMQWSAVAGGFLIVGARYVADFEPSLYAKSEFWLDSPLLILIKLGVVLWMLCFAYIWTRFALKGRWSWVAQLGTTSLLVYWVHIELVYGSLLWRWKGTLDNGQTVLASVALIVLMVALSSAKTWISSQRFDWMRWRTPERAPAAAGGD